MPAEGITTSLGASAAAKTISAAEVKRRTSGVRVSDDSSWELAATVPAPTTAASGKLCTELLARGCSLKLAIDETNGRDGNAEAAVLASKSNESSISEPVCCVTAGSASVWLRWLAPAGLADWESCAEAAVSKGISPVADTWKSLDDSPAPNEIGTGWRTIPAPVRSCAASRPASPPPAPVGGVVSVGGCGGGGNQSCEMLARSSASVGGAVAASGSAARESCGPASVSPSLLGSPPASECPSNSLNKLPKSAPSVVAGVAPG